ncbi:hypothetical protein WNZ15_23475 [Roseibium sp. AS2]|uniref:hypothetical protein n=1 Tax=Roseibium sp. AS2 TaxID=3135781 RepID=UPI0031793317
MSAGVGSQFPDIWSIPMSFQDPFGPFRADFGPDLIRDDLVKVRGVDGHFAAPDFQVRDKSRFRRVKVVLLFAAATAALTFLLFIPIVSLELASVESVAVHGKTLTAAEYADRLRSLLFGTAIFALAVVSFIASAAIASGGVVVRPKAAGEAERPEKFGKMKPLTVGKVRNV